MPSSYSRRNQPTETEEDELAELSRAQAPKYVIYLLTVWLNEGIDSDPANWRFRLENPRTKAVQGFVGVERLTEGLVKMIGEKGNA